MNILKGKSKFTVKDFIRVLGKFDEETPIIFGTSEKDLKSACFCQDENLIFDLGEDFSREPQLRIITIREKN